MNPVEDEAYNCFFLSPLNLRKLMNSLGFTGAGKKDPDQRVLNQRVLDRFAQLKLVFVALKLGRVHIRWLDARIAATVKAIDLAAAGTMVLAGAKAAGTKKKRKASATLRSTSRVAAARPPTRSSSRKKRKVIRDDDVIDLTLS